MESNAVEAAGIPLHILISQIMRLYFSRNYALMERLDVHPGQVPLLFQLHHHGGMSQKELVSKLMVKPPTVTVMIRRMEKSGFIQRWQDEQDQRVSRIYLTPLGEETFQRLLGELKIVENECFADFSEEEKAGGIRLFTRAKENLEAACRRGGHLPCCELTERGGTDA